MYVWVHIFNACLAQVQAALGKTLLHPVSLFITPTVQSQELLPPPPAPRQSWDTATQEDLEPLVPPELGGALAPAEHLLPPTCALGGRAVLVSCGRTPRSSAKAPGGCRQPRAPTRSV